MDFWVSKFQAVALKMALTAVARSLKVQGVPSAG